MNGASLLEALQQDKDLPVDVSSNIDSRDGMFKENLKHYMSCGRDALLNILLAQASAKAQDPATVLDFACGFGRVARHIRAAYPQAEITFTDAMPDATSFCTAAFGGRDRPISKDLTGYDPDRRFDLIWVGSLFTHLPERKSVELIELLFHLTAPGGTIVLTSHGRYVWHRRSKGTWPYAIDATQYDAMIRDVGLKGYGFTGYKSSESYGISLASLGWWEQTIDKLDNAEIVMLRERGWDRHQDVIAIKRLT